VAKKALCLSERCADDHLKQLDRTTIAVAFLGTPHRGSTLAPYATSITNILNAIKRVNVEILEVLQRNSEVLNDVENGFAAWLRKNSSRFNLACFYEELELPARIGLVRIRSWITSLCSTN
jgi:hypothetical protein